MDRPTLAKTSSTNDYSSSELQYSLPPPITSLNYDVLTKITESIGGNTSPDSRRRDGCFCQLYYFALTCKTFVGLALDELWRSMDSIVPLLKILPALQYKDNRYFVLTGNIHMEDLKRMEAYSKRIRIFSLNERSVPAMAQLAVPILMPFLPKVQRLNYTFANPFVKTWSPVILSERLQYFRLEGYFFSNTQDVKGILHALQFTAPALGHLDLVDPVTDDALNVVPTFVHLQSLGIHGIIDHHQFRQFSLLPKLRQLTVNFDVSGPFPSFSLEERITVPKLEVLHVTGIPLTIASVLASMYGGPVKAIQVTFHRETETLETSIDKCIATLKDQWPSTLRSFSLNLIACSKILHFLSAPQLDSFSQLASLEILHISGFTLDTHRCKILSQSIPSIKELKFEIFDSNEHSQSLEFLQFIAKSCPRISVLQVKCIHGVHLDTIPDSMLSNISLITLTFETYNKYGDNIGLQEVTTIARYIDLLFPCLETITTSEKAKAFASFWRRVFYEVNQSQHTKRDTKKQLTACSVQNSQTEQGEG